MIIALLRGIRVRLGRAVGQAYDPARPLLLTAYRTDAAGDVDDEDDEDTDVGDEEEEEEEEEEG